MTETCPISPNTVDDRSTRIGAAVTILVVIASLWSGRFWIPLLLSADFALRSRGWITFSPIAQISKALRTAFGINSVPINAGPKRFAALVGAIFSLGIALALFFHFPKVALIVASILVLCAALEAFVGYCVGCKIYGLLNFHNPGQESHPHA